jgi:hypothetical protein
MSLATFSGPVRIGNVRNTTGTTAGTIRNTGVITVLQYSSSFSSTASTASTGIVIPAGSIVTDVFVIQTTQFTSGTTGTITALINGTSFAVGSVSGAGATTNIVAAPSSLSSTAGVGSSIWLNTGTTDGIITVTCATMTAGAGILCIHYAVRNPDGTYAPTSFTGP